MKNILLTGAGFSRNWGGWLANEMFEFLLGCPEVMQSERLRQLLWRHQREANGFESALGELTVVNIFKGSQQTLTDLRGMQQAVASAFEHMNSRFWEQPFENMERPMTSFLAKFDALFTLNQDLLLDYHYNPALVFPADGKKWRGVQLPGMRQIPAMAPLQPDACPNIAYVEDNPLCMDVEADMQPVYKLHGSYGWSAAAQDSMLIMGDNKAHDIEGSNVLSEYFERFIQVLKQQDTRLMVIGYSFRDDHINQVIIDAVIHHGLRFFVVDPIGSALAKPETVPPQSLHKTTLIDAFETGLIGASRRSLAEIFASDAVEYAKLMRFFSRV